MHKTPYDLIKNRAVSRRDFLKTSSMGTLALAAAGGFPGKTLAAFDSPAQTKSKVILIQHSDVIDAAGRIQTPLVQKMIDKAVIAFSGESSLKEAWGKYFTSEDVVGLKVNTLGLTEVQGMDYVQHFSVVTKAVASGLKQVGIKEENMIVWDRSDEELTQAGFSINRESGGMRVMGNKTSRRGSEGRFNPKSYPVGANSSRVSAILADMCTSMVSIPVVKTHGNSAFTCSLKTHYGTIDNPREFHPNNCTNPGIPEVNTIPIIRERQKLIVCDAMMAAIEGGPRWNRRFTKPYGGILVGTDPVAIDTIAVKILDGIRAKEEMEPIALKAVHIPLSAELGVGTNNPSNIELIELTI